MLLKESFENTGSWLFRWRGQLPYLLLGMFLFAMPEYNYPLQSKYWEHIWEIFCLIVSFSGLFIRIYTIGYTPKGTSGRNTKEQIADTLNTKGIYSIVRNPLYLGNFFMGLGFALFQYLWYLPIIYTLIFWLYYERIIYTEEAYLLKKFGHQYYDWAKKTPIFIPKFSLYQKPDFSFSIKNILKREYNGFFVIVIIMFWLETISEFFVTGEFYFEKEWVVFFILGLLIWASLRALKKYTSILVEEGR